MLLGTALLVLRTDLVARVLGRTAEAFAEGVIGEEVTVGTARVSYFPPELALDGVVVHHRATGERILSVQSVQARLGVYDWQPGMVRLTIDGPDVALHLDDDGLREFRDVIQRPSGAPRPSRFPWHELVVNDGHFLLEGQDLRVELSDLDVVPVGSGLADVSFGALDLRRGHLVQQAGPTTFARVELAPDRVVAPAIRLALDDLSVRGRVAVVAEGPVDAQLEVSVELPAFTANSADPRRYVDGAVDASVSVSGPLSAPVTTAHFATHGVVAWRLSSKGQPVALALGDMSGTATVEGGSVRIDGVDMAWGEGTAHVEGVVDLDHHTLVADLRADDVHLAPILRATGAFAAPWVDFEGDVEAHVAGTLDPFVLAGPFSVTATNLVVRDGPVDGHDAVMLAAPPGRVAGTLALDDTHIVIDGQEFHFQGTRGRAWADIGFAPEGPLTVRADLRTLDLSQLAPLGGAGLGGVAEVHGELSGPFNHLSATATIDGRDVVVIDKAIADRMLTTLESPDLKRLSFRDIRATLGQSNYIGNFDLVFLPEGMWIDTDVVVPSGRIADLAGIFVDLPGLDGAVVADASLRGHPRRLSGEVRAEFDDVDLFGERFEYGVATTWMDDGVLTISDLTLRRREEAILARGSVGHGYAMNVEVLSDGLRLEGLDHLRGLPVDVAGEVVADVVVTGTLFDWRPRGRLALARSRVGSRAADDSRVTFATDDTGRLAWDADLLGRAVQATGSLRLADDLPYDLHARLDDVPLHLLYPEAADGNPVVLTTSGEVDLAGNLRGDDRAAGIDARLSEVYLRWNAHELRNPEPWVFAIHGNGVQVPGISLREGERTNLSLEGWSIGTGRASFTGGGQLDLDLARLFVPGVPLLEGTAKVNVRIVEGSADAPVEVSLESRGATLRTDWFPHPFTGLRFEARATRHGYTVTGVRADVGGGKFTGEGTISAEGWRPTRYDLRGQLADARVQYLDYLPPITGDADLRFDGPVGDLLLGGRVVIDDMQFRDRIDWESKIVALQSSRLTSAAGEDRTDYFAMDLAVEAADTVRLRNNLADADASASLRIVGDTARPGMVGNIRVRPGGRMYLQDREFEITRGEIRYVDPFTFDPDLDIMLETDVNGRERDYHVYYAVTGPFSNWRTTTSSDPYLSQADINTLLLFGMTRDEFEQYGGVAAVALGAQAVDLVAAQTPTGATINELVDRWNVSSGITARGSPTLDSSWRIVGQKDLGPYTLTGEFVIDSQDWYIGAERRITRGFIVGSYVTSEEEGRALSLGSALGAEFKYRWELD